MPLLPRTPLSRPTRARRLRQVATLALAGSAALSSLAVAAPCDEPYTHAYSIQGRGETSPLAGTTVTVQGVVVGDYEGSSASGALRGFYLQDLQGDGDAATSDAVFVFNANNDNVSVGQVVRLSGAVSEFQGQTQVSLAAGSLQLCGTGSVAPVDVTLPFASATDAERYEGMLVRLPQRLFVTEQFQLGRFGQVVLAVDGRQKQPTNFVAPGPEALAMEAQNRLGRIILDDGRNSQNPDPIVFGRGGQPLSASNTLRAGDSVAGVVGVMTYTWAGNAASGNAYRVRPVNALGASLPNFEPTNPRPTAAPQVRGTLRVVGMNVLNFFNTVGDCTGGVGAAPIDCRGAGSDAGSAANQAAQFAVELPRQTAKTIAALKLLDADVAGLIEVENNGYGPNSALRYLVDQLNAATAPGTYALIDVDARTGQLNAMGSDAIRTGFIYKPARVTPVGRTAALNSVAFVNGGDSGPRNRPALAQAFEQTNGARFVAVINHLKSKGSACDVPDANDGQANCALVRTAAARLLRDWLATDPTGTGDPDVLILGDLNSYAKEDPVAVLTTAGYRNLIALYDGPDAYGYGFDGQWGYIDHALASPSLANGQVAYATHWHINSDEPTVLDYNVNFKSTAQIASLYAPDEFRNSDHDPAVVDLMLKAPTVITGTAGNDTLVGTPGDDIITGLGGRDTLTGGGGRNQFVFTSVLDGGDTITDFKPGIDLVDFRPLLQGLGVRVADPIAAGYVSCSASGNDALISVDPDGSAGPAARRPMLLLKNQGCLVLSPVNFRF